MERLVKHLSLLGALMAVELSVSASDRAANNVCDITDKRSQIHCYCDSSVGGRATWADCWVLGGGLTADDPVWSGFVSQPAVTHLSFNVRSEGALTFVPAKAVVRLDRLAILTIQFGSIYTVPAFAFTNSSSLRRITLESNEIHTLELNAFARLERLTNLSLDDNQISELRRGVFVELPALRRLLLTNNNISLVHERCFDQLNNLLELRLDNNVVSVVTREMFEGLESLVKLDLRNNKLTMLGNLAFSDLLRLKELNLDHNAIEFISERSFGGLSLLRDLTLSGNKLVAFHEDIIEYLQSLELLDLSENLLETVSYDTIRSLVERERNTGVFYINGNPLICDCRLSWANAAHNDTKSPALRHALDKITCITHNDNQLIDNNSVEKHTNEVRANNEDFEYYEEKPKSNLVSLIDLPIGELPCRAEYVKAFADDGHPVQNEIRLKAYSKAQMNRSTCIFVVTLFALM